MVAVIQKNPDLPTSYQVPGVYTYLSLVGSGPSQLNRRVLLLGYKTSAGSAQANVPIRLQNEDDANNFIGKGSDITRGYRAFISHLVGGAGADVWACPIAAPSGTAQTTLLQITSAPTSGAPGTNTAAQAAGIMTIWIEGYPCPVSIANGDSLSTITTNALAEINKVADFLSVTPAQSGTPIVFGTGTSTMTFTAKQSGITYQEIQAVGLSVATSHTFVNGALVVTLGTDGAGAPAGTPAAIKTNLDTDPTVAAAMTYVAGAGTTALSAVATTILPFNVLTLTARHAALTSQDIPVMTAFSNVNMGLAISPGTITLANAAGTPAGVHTVFVTTQAVTYAPANAEAVNTSATNLAAAINAANAFPVSAAASGPVVTLYYVDTRIWNRPTVSTTDTSQTITLAAGAVGAGLPNLTNALNNIAALDGFSLWVTNFTDSTSLGTLSTHIESQANGRIQKGQRLVITDTQKLTTAGTIPTTSSPALTASPRYFLSWCAGSPQQAHELAARVAAEIISQDYPSFNYMGRVLKTTPNVPLLLPHPAVRPTDADVNAAMVTYFMTPLRVNSQGQLYIVSGRTTAKPGASIAFQFVFWGTILTTDYCREDLGSYLFQAIQGKNIKAFGPPNTSNVITVDGIIQLVFSRMVLWESLDILDGVDNLKSALAAAINPTLPSRVDINLPLRETIPLEQLSIFAQQVP